MLSSFKTTLSLLALAAVIFAGGHTYWLLTRERGPDETPPAATTPQAPPATPAPPVDSNPVTPSEPGLDELLAAGDNAAVVERYETARTRSEAEAAAIRRDMLAHAQRLIETRKLPAAERLMRAYSDIYFQDMHALLLMAEIHSLQGRLADSLDYLTAARNAAYESTDVLALNKDIVDAAGRYREELLSYDDRHSVVTLYQELYNRYPDISELSLQLAKAKSAIGEPREAWALLQQLRLDPSYQQRAEDLLSAIEPELRKHYQDERDATRLEIPMERSNEQYLLSATANGLKVKLLLDTGASISTLTPAVLRRIAAQSLARDIVLHTANGRRTSGLYRVRNFAMGSLKLHDFEVASIKLDGLSDIDGLLGTDFLNLFHYSIDNGSDTLVLAPLGANGSD